VSYGGRTTAKLIWTQLGRATHPPAPSSRRYFLVQVLALNTDFLAFHESGTLTVIPLLNDPQRRWSAGELRSADQVFGLLSVDAGAANDLPR